MANERMYPCLPSHNIHESITFYQSLGFKCTYRQARPNPYAVVTLDDMHIHLFGMEGFNPADSYGSVIVVVPDPDELYHTFAARLRETFGKLPSVGMPRILRPRKKFGTVSGFSMIDPSGNWLRIYKLGDTNSTEKEEGLSGTINVAARLGDTHGDEAKALKTLESGLKRFPKAPTTERVRAYLYRAELAIRIKDPELALASLEAAKSLELTDAEQSALAEEFAHANELIAQV